MAMAMAMASKADRASWRGPSDSIVVPRPVKSGEAWGPRSGVLLPSRPTAAVDSITVDTTRTHGTSDLSLSYRDDDGRGLVVPLGGR